MDFVQERYLKDKYIGDMNLIKGLGDGRICSAISASSTIRLSPDLEYVQLWNGTEWVNWKASGLNWDGTLVKNSVIDTIHLPNGFSNGLSISSSTPTYAGQTVTSITQDAINCEGYDKVVYDWTAQGSAISNYGPGHAYENHCYAYGYFDIYNGETNEIIKTETLYSWYKDNMPQNTWCYSENYVGTGASVDISGFSVKKLKFGIRAFSRTNNYNQSDISGNSVSTVNLSNLKLVINV